MKNSYSQINNICLIIIASFVVALTLHYTRSALIPFVFSIFLYATLAPLVSWIERHSKLNRSFATAIAFTAMVGAMVLIVVIVVSSVDNFIQGASQYRESLQNTIELGAENLRAWGIEVHREKLIELSNSLPLIGFAKSFTGYILSFVGNILMVFIFTLFMLAGEQVREEPRKPMVREILLKVSTYISAKTFLSLITGFFVWLTLVFFKVEMAFVFALLTIMLNFIPTVGSLFAVALPVPILFLQYQFTWPFWVVISICMAVQFFIGNIVESKMLGDSMDLHPITVLICLIFWGLIWGVAGMFLAVPITAILKIVLSKIPSTRSFSEILAGRFG